MRLGVDGAFVRTFSAAIVLFLQGRAADLPNKPAFGGERWSRFAAQLCFTSIGSVALLVSLLFILNPFGNFPTTFASQRFAHSNQRYSYPSIVRSSAYDSAIFGTSTSRLLQPADWNQVLGGHFANLSMDASSAWEQTQLAQLFLRHTPHVRTLVLSLDSFKWCSASADRDRITFRLFPTNFYDENPINDLSDILNLELYEVLRRSLKMLLGFQQPYFDEAGFGDFTPGEARYDAEQARLKIGRTPAAIDPPVVPTAEEIAAYDFPALKWLSQTLAAARPQTDRIILVRMPVHVAAQPQMGSAEASRDGECRNRELAIGKQFDAFVIDMAFPSAITSTDVNYWDSLHFRQSIARRISSAVGQALETGRSTDLLKVDNVSNSPHVE